MWPLVASPSHRISLDPAHNPEEDRSNTGQPGQQHWPAPASDRRRLARLPGVGARERLPCVGARERPAQEGVAPSGQAIPGLLGAQRVDVTLVPAVVMYNVHACNSLPAC